MSSEPSGFVFAATAVAIGGRALLIEGPPGAGKSSLALALLDRGAVLIGDDAVTMSARGHARERHLLVAPPPNIAGLIEVRGVGLMRVPVAPPCPAALILMLGGSMAERLPERADQRLIGGVSLPSLAFHAGAIAPALRAEAALALHGLALPEKRGASARNQA